MTDRLTAQRPGLTPAQVRSSRPGYAVLRGVSTLVAAVMIGGASISLVPDMAVQEDTSTVVLEGEARSTLAQAGSVLVEGGRGDIVVREVAEGASPSVTTTSRWAFREPELSLTEGAGGQLVVSAPCPAGNWGRCAVGFELTVPVGTVVDARASLGSVDVVSSGDVSVTTSLGDVSVGGEPGAVRVETSLGSVTVDGDPDAVRVETSLGDIRVTGTPTTVEAEASLGGVHVLAQEPPDLVSVTTSLGDVDVEVPGGVSYAVDTDTSQGDQDVRVSRDPAAPHTLWVRTSRGSIRITPTG